MNAIHWLHILLFSSVPDSENTSAQTTIERLRWPKFLTRFLLAFDPTALNFPILFSLYTAFLEAEYIGSLRLVDLQVKMLGIYFSTTNSLVQAIPDEYNGCSVALDIPTAVIIYRRCARVYPKYSRPT
jgi:hypothetical protein